ncbi:MAG: hypothetical protein LBG46_06065 [Elusimicrobiota bacterium]|jgi:hypothetical protein|nr:hypothetical protein [Elusimicrobiota bacterium]
MKKLLAVSLAFALFVPAFAGGILDNVTTKGEIQTIGSLLRAEYQNVDVNSRTVSNRVLFGLGFDLVDDVKADVTFLNVGYWGSEGAPSNGQSLDDYLNKIRVVEANVTVDNIFGVLTAKIGRQFYGDENSPVVYYGPTHYKGGISDNFSTGVRDSESADAVVVTYASDSFTANAVYGKLAQQSQPNVNDANSVLGLDAKYNVNDSLSLQAYLYNIAYPNSPLFGGESVNIGLYGGKAAYADDALLVSVEVAKNYNNPYSNQRPENRPFFYNEGWMVKADASFKLALEQADITPRLTYVHSEQNFIAVGNYLPGIMTSGFNGQAFSDGRNMRVVNAGVDFKLPALEKFNFALEYFAVSYRKEDNPLWIGNEFDLLVKYALNEYVELHTGIAYGTNTIFKENPYAGQLGLIVKF